MSDNDAESDTESYFLTPVNEYNIVDKIQLANNQLFASITENNAMEIFETETITTNKIDKNLLQSKHRVTFSSDIEEYEDEMSEAESAEIQYKDDDDEAIEKEIAEIIERGERQPSITIEPIDNDQIDGLLKRISIEEIYSNDEDSLSVDNDYATELEVVEEINETIVNEMKISEFEKTPSPVPIIKSDSDNANLRVQNNIETEEKKRPPILGEMNANDNPPCRACNNKSTSARNNIKSAGMKRSSNTPSKRIVSANMQRNVVNKNNSNHDDLLKIHLNVRACCENKYLDNNRLPRYNGYISQYGLSKDQLEMREMNRQKYLEKRARREREIQRAKQQIEHLNELAFQQWLIRKNHLARPKYKNMYDTVMPRPQSIKYHSSTKFQKSSGNSS